MRLTGKRGVFVQVLGVGWILMSPVVFAMAAISTVESETTYRAQLAAFSAVAIAAVVFGVAGVMRRSWAALGFLVLSSLGAAYFFIAALLILIGPFVPRSTTTSPGLGGPLALMIAPVGLPFIIMAVALGVFIRKLRTEARTGDA
jgi:hypothetical protein